MKILHTSDWHIGRSLYGRKRYEETQAFLTWLADLIDHENIDILLVAGDIFDNTTPSNRSQELYYQFLCRVAASSCGHVVIIAGNHDSPSFLNAPRELLRFLNVHVVGSISDNINDEVLVLANANGEPEIIVCAVPYLRDREIRRAEAGESFVVKEHKLVEGIHEHYQQVVAEAEKVRAKLNKAVPLVVMGHLFTAGGRTVEGDGVRDLYVGSLAYVNSDIFPPSIDYLALGHLHLPQKVGGKDNWRYSGSPLPLGFGEARQEKFILQVEFAGQETMVTPICVPHFQALESIKGDWETITNRLEELKSWDSSSWLEIIYDGDEIMGDLRQQINEIVDGTLLEVLKVRNNRVLEKVISRVNPEEKLNDLGVKEVFQRCLEAHQISQTQQAELLVTYQEVINSILEEDQQAE